MKKYLLFLFFVVSHLWALADGEWALVGLKYVIHKTDNNCTGEFHNGMAIVQDAWNEQGYYDAGASQLYGAIDTSGKLVIPCIYQSMTDFINGFSVVEKMVNTVFLIRGEDLSFHWFILLSNRMKTYRDFMW